MRPTPSITRATTRYLFSCSFAPTTASTPGGQLSNPPANGGFDG